MYCKGGGGLINSKVILERADFGKVVCVINSKVILKKNRLRYKFKTYIEKLSTAL